MDPRQLNKYTLSILAFKMLPDLFLVCSSLGEGEFRIFLPHHLELERFEKAF